MVEVVLIKGYLALNYLLKVVEPFLEKSVSLRLDLPSPMSGDTLRAVPNVLSTRRSGVPVTSQLLPNLLVWT